MQQLLGDYTLLKLIGQGALGSTYLAEHRFLKRQFVIKILPEEMTKDRAFIQRFEEEVGLLASLEHSHIVKIHTVSFVEGVYFLVMDCVVDSLGETTHLGQYMMGRKERLREEELMKVLKQVADALDYAHKKNPSGKESIVHRNLKLSNILISRNKTGLEVMISDFGLTKLIGTGAVISRTYKAMADSMGVSVTESVSKTQDDKYSVTPFDIGKVSKLNQSFLQNYAFLAPEQKHVEEKRIIDGRTDSYAFGVLVYYLITGRFPEGYFTLPSEVAPDYTFDWDSLVKGCLQDRPEKRPLELLPLLNSPSQQKRNLTEMTKVTLDSKEVQELVQTKIDHIKTDSVKTESILTPEVQSTVNSHFLEVPSEGSLVGAFSAQAAPIFETVPQQAIAQGVPQTYTPPKAAPVIESVKIYEQEVKDSLSITPIPTEMKHIAGGSYMRGSNEGNRDEMPRHTIHITDFALDIHPVTNEQFVRFLEFMGGEKDANFHDLIRLKDSRIKRAAGKLSIESGYSKHPVVGVTWYGAVAYAQWIGKRLPTEAEWEIASRGGLESCIYPTGDSIEKTQANFFSSDTIAVMSYQPNGYGLYDMAGNVYEWCQDWYGYNYYEASAVEPNQPKGPLQGVYRVLRGGCWKSLKDDLRCSHRHRNNPGAVNGTYGFRCASDI